MTLMSGRTTVWRIGRGHLNDVVIDDPSISREHAELHRRGRHEYRLIDLNSTNGTCVREGSRWLEIESATVEEGERVLIGDVVTTVTALLEEAAERARNGDLAEKNAPSLWGLRVPRLSRHVNTDLPTQDGGRAADGPSLFGGGAHAALEPTTPLERPREMADAADFGAASGAEIDRQARRVDTSDVARLVGSWRRGGAKPAPAYEAHDAAHDSAAADAAVPGRLITAQDLPRADATAQDADPATEAGPVRPFPGLAAPRNADTGRDGPSFPGLEGSVVPDPPEAPQVDAGSIVVDRRGSFRVSPRAGSGRAAWDPPRQRAGRGRGFSRWLAIALGLVFLASAAAAGVVVYATKDPVKISRKAPGALAAKPAPRPLALAIRKAPATAATPKPESPGTKIRPADAIREAISKLTPKPAPRAAPQPAPEKPAAAKKPKANPAQIIRNLIPLPTATTGPATKVGAKYWAHVYGGAGERGLTAVAPARGGGAFAAGHRAVRDGGQTAWILRLDSYGNVIWQATTAGIGGRATALTPIRDGGVVVAGAGKSGREIWIARYDKFGEEKWRRALPSSLGAPSAILRFRGGFVVAAADRTGSGTVQALIVRLKGDGEVIWSRRYGVGYNRPTGLARAGRRGFIVVGAAREQAGAPSRLWVLRLDHEGLRRWQRTYPVANPAGSAGKGADTGAAFIGRARRGTFIIATTRQVTPGPGLPPVKADARILRIDRRGDVMWDHILRTDYPDQVSGMVLQKGGVVLAGATYTGGGQEQDMWLARVNTDGTLAWQRRYGSKQHDGAAALAEGRRGALYVAGATAAATGQQAQTTVSRAGWVLKLDRAGRLAR